MAQIGRAKSLLFLQIITSANFMIAAGDRLATSCQNAIWRKIGTDGEHAPGARKIS
jgi:hypothetical protein